MMPESRSPKKRSCDTGSRSSHIISALVNDLVGDLQSALTTTQRLAVLQRILEFLQYNSQTDSFHVDGDFVSSLVEAGMVTSLVMQLNHVLQQRKNKSDSVVSVVSDICRLLSLLAGYSSNNARFPAAKILCDQHVMRLLSIALTLGVVTPVLTILHVVSTQPSGALEILKPRELLSALVVSLTIENVLEQDLLEGLGCLKNISCYAQERRCQILMTPNMKEVLCLLARRCRSDKSQEGLSAVFRNLSVAPDCRSIIVGDAEILKALLHLSNHAHNKPLLRNILNTFITISMDHDACVVLLFHANGVLLQRIKMWLIDGDVVVRKRTSRLVRSLANEISAPLLVHEAEFMELISSMALQDDNQAVRIEATEAFARCAALVQTGQPHYKAVLDALVRLAKRPNASSEALASALREQTAHLVNRVAIAECTELVEAVARLAQSRSTSTRAKENICIALLDLAHEDSNLKRLATRPVILDALVQNANDTESVQLSAEAKRNASIQTLLLLVKCPKNRATMVNHHGLLESLIRYATSTPDVESKRKIKSAILSLVGEM